MDRFVRYRYVIIIIIVGICLSLTTTLTKAAPFDAVGSSDFHRLVVEDGVFVDRSMFIVEYFRKWRGKNLIVRPRHFGKSVNMDMLKRFMEIEVDENGVRLSKSLRKNRVLFTGGNVTNCNGTRITLKALEIVNHTSTFERQGKVPVVFVSLKNVRGLTYDRFENATKYLVADLYGRHGYVRKNLTGPDDREDLNTFDRYAAANVTGEELSKALDFLTRKVQRYFDNRKVHLLVDDYDTPLRNLLHDALDYGHRRFNQTDEQMLYDTIDGKSFRRSVRLIAGLLGNALSANNPSVEQALITGQFPLSRTDMAPELKDVREYSVMNKPFSEFYGFYETEVGKLAGQVAVKGRHKDMKRWYKGYNFAANVIYNPYSTMRCLQHGGECRDYWVETGTNDIRFVRHMLEQDDHYKELHDLFDGDSLEMDVKNSKFSYVELASGDLLRYLLFTGYVTPLWRKAKKTPVLLKVPNYEVKSAFRSSLLYWAEKKYNLNANQTERAAKFLADDNVHEFRVWLRDNCR